MSAAWPVSSDKEDMQMKLEDTIARDLLSIGAVFLRRRDVHQHRIRGPPGRIGID